MGAIAQWQLDDNNNNNNNNTNNNNNNNNNDSNNKNKRQDLARGRRRFTGASTAAESTGELGPT
jgi:hypothetical protein